MGCSDCSNGPELLLWCLFYLLLLGSLFFNFGLLLLLIFFFLFLSKISKADGSLVVVLGLFGAPFGLPRPLIGPLGSLRSTTVPDPSSRREMADMWTARWEGGNSSSLVLICSTSSSVLLSAWILICLRSWSWKKKEKKKKKLVYLHGECVLIINCGVWVVCGGGCGGWLFSTTPKMACPGGVFRRTTPKIRTENIKRRRLPFWALRRKN